ncbi:FBXW2 [Ceraceosorus bombacis]|uniref:FBXW2 n=1 Tax=Ceraceosorus bombacis TaxID=401625 RepID=A0A0P1BF76_9BASI|nr:FBXW2 [Ceraceosorus bombacis]
MAPDPLRQLPAELQVMVLIQLDPKTLFISRRVSQHWMKRINAYEEVWRALALQWRLIPRWTSPLPGSQRAGGGSVSSYPNERACEAVLSVTGYFNNITSFRDLCDRYLRLTLAWKSATGPSITENGSDHPLVIRSQFGHLSRCKSSEEAEETFFLQSTEGFFVLAADCRTLQMFQHRFKKDFAAQDDLLLYSTLKLRTEDAQAHKWFAEVVMDAGFAVVSSEKHGVFLFNLTTTTCHFEGALPLPTRFRATSYMGTHLHLRYPSCLVFTWSEEADTSVHHIHLFDVPTKTLCFSIKVLGWCCDMAVNDERTMIAAVHEPSGLAVYSTADGSVLLNMMPNLNWSRRTGTRARMRGRGTTFGPSNVHIAFSTNRPRSCSVDTSATEAANWRTVESICSRTGEYDGISAADFITAYVYSEYLTGARKVYIDAHTDTLILLCLGHAILVRPCSAIARRELHRDLQLGVLPLSMHIRQRKKSKKNKPREHVADDEFFAATPHIHPRADLPYAASDRRLCVAFSHSKLHQIFIIDLDLHRLSESTRQHPFGNVGSRLLMQTAASEVSDIQLDACGAFLLSSRGMLGYDLRSLLDAEASQGTNLDDDGAQRIQGGADDASKDDVFGSSLWTDSEAEGEPRTRTRRIA